VRRATIGGWESGKSEPRPPEREACARLLEQLGKRYPRTESVGAPREGTAAPQTVPPTEKEHEEG
jgi:hypothetical protein